MPSPLQQLNYIIPIVSPIGYGITNLGNASQQVIGANPVRRRLVFWNPNPLNTIWLCPGAGPATKGGGSVPLFPSSGPYDATDENVNNAWQAIADAGTNQGLTILEFL
jgi:hypothetical protein